MLSRRYGVVTVDPLICSADMNPQEQSLRIQTWGSTLVTLSVILTIPYSIGKAHDSSSMGWEEAIELRFAEQRLALADLPTPNPSFSAFSPGISI
jgi:hypothetical protein